MESLGLRRSVRSLVTASLLMAALAFLMECQNPTGSQDTRPRIAAIVLVPTNVSKPPLLPARDTICFLDTLKYQAIPYDSQGHQVSLARGDTVYWREYSGNGTIFPAVNLGEAFNPLREVFVAGSYTAIHDGEIRATDGITATIHNHAPLDSAQGLAAIAISACDSVFVTPEAVTLSPGRT